MSSEGAAPSTAADDDGDTDGARDNYTLEQTLSRRAFANIRIRPSAEGGTTTIARRRSRLATAEGVVSAVAMYTAIRQ